MSAARPSRCGLADLFNPPRIAPPTGGRIIISGKPAAARDLEPGDIGRDTRAARAEQQRNYYERHKTKVNARKRAYRERNRDRVSAYQRKYRESLKLKGENDGNA